MTTKKTDNKKSTNAFNLTESLDTMEVSNMLKSGFKYYIEVNNLKINSVKQLETEMDKFKKLDVGV